MRKLQSTENLLSKMLILCVHEEQGILLLQDKKSKIHRPARREDCGLANTTSSGTLEDTHPRGCQPTENGGNVVMKKWQELLICPENSTNGNINSSAPETTQVLPGIPQGNSSEEKYRKFKSYKSRNRHFQALNARAHARTHTHTHKHTHTHTNTHTPVLS